MKNKGFTLVELLVVIAILGILMVALVPNIMGAIAKAQMQTMAKQGADIVNALNTESLRDQDLWPHLTEKDGLSDDTDEISGNTYGTSTEYFKKLFDIENQNGGNWRPYIDVKLDFLWGNGVPSAQPGSLDQRNVAWTIVAGASAMGGEIPALITRNADTSSFVTSGNNDMSKNKNEVPLEKYPNPFGKKGCVVVMKDGSASARPSRECRLCDIYAKRTVNIPDGMQLKYLEP